MTCFISFGKVFLIKIYNSIELLIWFTLLCDLVRHMSCSLIFAALWQMLTRQCLLWQCRSLGCRIATERMTGSRSSRRNSGWTGSLCHWSHYSTHCFGLHSRWQHCSRLSCLRGAVSGNQQLGRSYLAWSWNFRIADAQVSSTCKSGGTKECSLVRYAAHSRLGSLVGWLWGALYCRSMAWRRVQAPGTLQQPSRRFCPNWNPAGAVHGSSIRSTPTCSSYEYHLTPGLAGHHFE